MPVRILPRHKDDVIINAKFEISNTICRFLPSLRVRSSETLELHLKMHFDASSENNIIGDITIFSLDWQNIQI